MGKLSHGFFLSFKVDCELLFSTVDACAHDIEWDESLKDRTELWKGVNFAEIVDCAVIVLIHIVNVVNYLIYNTNMPISTNYW